MSKKDRIEKAKKMKELAEKAGISVKRAKKCIVYRMAALCGCCHEDLYFKNDQSAHEALKKAGLTATEIVDDIGIKHENVDLFYGIWRADKEEERSGGDLTYLMDLVTEKKKWP